MKIIVPIALVLAAVVAALPAPGIAQAVQVGPGRYAVTVSRAALSAATPASARRALHRIDRAATVACGGSAGSLREVTRAVEASACFREAVGDAVRRIDAPLLYQAWQYRR